MSRRCFPYHPSIDLSTDLYYQLVFPAPQKLQLGIMSHPSRINSKRRPAPGGPGGRPPAAPHPEHPSARARTPRPRSPPSSRQGPTPAPPPTLAEIDYSQPDAFQKLCTALRAEIAGCTGDIVSLKEQLEELTIRTNCEEAVEKMAERVEKVENANVTAIRWRIGEIEKVRRDMRKGQFLRSPEFSVGGLGRKCSLHFYPKGDDFAEEG